MKNKAKIIVISGGLFITLVVIYMLTSLDAQEDPINEPSITKASNTQADVWPKFLIDESYSSLTKIELSSQDNLTFIKEDGKWIRESNKELPINQAHFLTFENNISNLERRVIRSSPTEGELKEFGLENYSIGKIYYDNGNVYEFKIGTFSPAATGMYFSINDDDTIYLDNGDIKLFITDFDQFLDVNINFPNLSDISLVKWKSKDGIEFIITGAPIQNDDDIKSYKMTEPININIDTSLFNNKVINRIKKFSFIQGTASYNYHKDNNNYGFKDPHLSLYMEDTAGKNLSLVIGDEFVRHGYFALYNDRKEVYLFAYENIDELTNLNIIEYVNRNIFNFDRLSFKEIKFIYNDIEHIIEENPKVEGVMPKIDYTEVVFVDYIKIVELFENMKYDTVYIDKLEFGEDIYPIIKIEILTIDNEEQFLNLYDYDEFFYETISYKGISGLISKKYIHNIINNIESLSNETIK